MATSLSLSSSAIRSAVGSTQVSITNNLFINFGSSAVEASGRSDPTHYPSANTTITGNLFDMTEIGDKSVSRTAVDVSASDAIVSDVVVVAGAGVEALHARPRAIAHAARAGRLLGLEGVDAGVAVAAVRRALVAVVA